MNTLELSRCPELDDKGEVCGAIAEIIDRFVLDSTDGPVEHLTTRCLDGHVLRCLAESFEEPVIDSLPVITG